MAWRLAKSLEQLRKQINERWPARSKVSDGSVGDLAHSARKSDHNPNAAGVVCAIDITNDPHNGIPSEALAEMLRAARDPRLSYLISNRKISNSGIGGGEWRPYGGDNPHNHHVHISVKQDAALYDDERAWLLGEAPSVEGPIANTSARPLLRKGDSGASVRDLQQLLQVTVDGQFGPKTEAAVEAFQRAKGLAPDGIVGPYTWDALRERKAS